MATTIIMSGSKYIASLRSKLTRSTPGTAACSITATRSTASDMTTVRDWEPSRYLRFGDERTRAAQDLLAQVPLSRPACIVDLGCGPGNSTALLSARYPDGEVHGMDSSPNMLKKARQVLPEVHFTRADLRTYTTPKLAHLLFSNATFQWLPRDERIPVIQRLLESQPAGGVFAIQVPDNHDEPSHRLMSETASDPNTSWKNILASHQAAREPFASPHELYNALKPLCAKIDIWHTLYQHRLDNHEAIADFLRSTGLRPFLEPLRDDETREAFMEAYIDRLRNAYPILDDGSVLLRFPRLFIVLHRM